MGCIFTKEEVTPKSLIRRAEWFESEGRSYDASVKYIKAGDMYREEKILYDACKYYLKAYHLLTIRERHNRLYWTGDALRKLLELKIEMENLEEFKKYFCELINQGMNDIRQYGLDDERMREHINRFVMGEMGWVSKLVVNKTDARLCMEVVAKMFTEQEEFLLAGDVYERMSGYIHEQFRIEAEFSTEDKFCALTCYIATEDYELVRNKIKNYSECYPYWFGSDFAESHQCKLIKDLLDTYDEYVQKYSQTCHDYDRIHSLAKWQMKMLLKDKEIITE